ncbi:DNA primase DnaG [Haladaptatus sp. GCM10025707]|uniref:DNA primase DnaG n=1 Tax=unclassified Haladaptatus TaxID=2622732 RepID=UPI0023E7FBBB|nr:MULTISPECIES: DNA primase DnaG [unclassified Haladaptatus]
MEDSAKYLIHADITADGVVERSDVVGAIFGQTEGLLGDDLDLRDLQNSSKVGRIDVSIDSERGNSFGNITIASSLDKVETAILAAALETIDRVGPCRSTVEVANIEDVRAAKRRRVVDRAKDLIVSAFDDSVLSSEELIEEVRRSIRVEDITEYEGLPAGPRVEDSDAIIVVEGRADVLTLLKYGIKNAIAVEGTNVPEAVAKLTKRKTVTAFLDGDRGGELILKELSQVGDLDFVAFAPSGLSVEDLDRHEVMAALREKVPYDEVTNAAAAREAIAATDGSARPAPPEAGGTVLEEPDVAVESDAEADESEQEASEDVAETDETSDGEASDDADEPRPEPETLLGHVKAVIGDETGLVRLLDDDFKSVSDAPAANAFDLLKDADVPPHAVVLDGELGQKVLDVAAQRGVEQIVTKSEGEFVKKPAAVRIRTADQLLA